MGHARSWQVCAVSVVLRGVAGDRTGWDLGKTSGAFGGGGWTAYRAEDIRYDSGRITVGLGWDFPLTPGWLVGNTVTLDAASFGSLKNERVTVDRDVGVSVLRLGVFIKRR